MSEAQLRQEIQHQPNVQEEVQRKSDGRKKTPYSLSESEHIKKKVRSVWERASSSRHLRQSGLANALGLSQGAVSKLLNNDKGHPWTVIHIRQFVEYCQVSIREIIDDEDIIEKFFRHLDNDKDEMERRIANECYCALQAYYEDSGMSPKKEALDRLAAKLAIKFKDTNRTKSDMEKAIGRVILEEAL